MNIDEIKGRFTKLVPRVRNMLDKYPVLSGAVIGSALLVGFVLGKWL